MNEEIKVDYKGFPICYHEYTNEWENSETMRHYDSLSKAKEAVDRVIKLAEKMEPIPCIRKKHGYSEAIRYIEAQIIGFDSEGTIWVRKQGGKGRGERVHISSYGNNEIFENTPENKETIKNIMTLETKKREISNLISENEKTLIPVDISAHYKKLVEKGAKA
jgi:hypothetical protein